MVTKIISGGQTGADQAALDFAIKHNIPHGGWIPKGRMTEDGPLPSKYQLQEMPTKSYPTRTEKNVVDSDGTLLLSHGKLSGGTALTRKLAVQHDKPWLHVDMDKLSVDQAAEMLQQWIQNEGLSVLNVAGSRASGDRDIYHVTVTVLEAALKRSRVQGNRGHS